jgi:hypothetical protein
MAIAKYHPDIVSEQIDLDLQEFPHSPPSRDSENSPPIIDLTDDHQSETLV